MTYLSFQNWAQVQAHVRKGLPLYYHAPLDHRPVYVSARVRQDGTVRVMPPGDADPFTADGRHLERFRRAVTVRKI